MDGADVPAFPKLRATPEEARRVPNDPGCLSARVLSHGTMEVRWFAPRDGSDPQAPHDRDEVYVVVSGTGTFMRAMGQGPFEEPSLAPVEERVPFAPGDVLMAPAGAVHRFEDFSEDFAAWTVFYGPEGGEAP